MENLEDSTFWRLYFEGYYLEEECGIEKNAGKLWRKSLWRIFTVVKNVIVEIDLDKVL